MAVVNDNSAEKAAVAAGIKAVPKETAWIDIDGYTVRFKRVPAFLYAQARQTLHQILSESMPQVPVAVKGNRTLENPVEPTYLRNKHTWDVNYNLQMRDVGTMVAILYGIELKDSVPPTDEWLPNVIKMMSIIGEDWESYRNSYQRLSDELFLELIFKKYVILASDEAVVQFTLYHKRNTAAENGQLNPDSAVAMFRSSEEQDTTE